jgi:prepilin-type N-terminal cleavage/methylation domain-containing protein
VLFLLRNILGIYQIMQNIFMKKGLRGFTLIELLVVIAIIGLLSTIIAAPIQNARKKAKDVKKVAELKSVANALDQYAEANGQYPTTLSALAPQYITTLPTYAGTSVPVRDRFAYVVYTGTPAGGTAVRFAYHLGVHMDVASETLSNDADCTGATADSTSITPPACTYFNGPVTPISYPAWVTGMVGTSATADFDGDDGDASCSTTQDCVFDITGTF